MGVEQDSGECRGIYPELLLLGNLGCQFGVEGMDTLNDQDVVGSHLQFLTAALTATFLEVVLGQFHLLAIEQRR